MSSEMLVADTLPMLYVSIQVYIFLADGIGVLQVNVQYNNAGMFWFL